MHPLAALGLLLEAEEVDGGAQVRLRDAVVLLLQEALGIHLKERGEDAADPPRDLALPRARDPRHRVQELHRRNWNVV